MFLNRKLKFLLDLEDRKSNGGDLEIICLISMVSQIMSQKVWKLEVIS